MSARRARRRAIAKQLRAHSKRRVILKQLTDLASRLGYRQDWARKVLEARRLRCRAL